jgi:hypothetical protein
MMTQKRVKELFVYNPKTGVMTNRYSRHRARKGKVSGCSRKRDGRWVIFADGKLHYRSRLAYLWVYGFMPDEIDHRNTDCTDDSIKNLRPATSSQNKANRHSRNKNGVKGVFRNGKGWMVQARKNGRLFHVGTFPTKRLAAIAYRIASVQIHGEFARW